MREVSLNYITTPIKSMLLQNDWGDAIYLLDSMLRVERDKTIRWFNTGSTIDLFNASKRFKGWAYYRDYRRNEPMPFDNDVCALDAVMCRIKNN